MRIQRVNAHQVGLVFRGDTYRRTISEGLYWFWHNEKVHLYDMRGRFCPTEDLDILLQDVDLACRLDAFIVRDSELGIYFKSGLLQEVFPPGKYTFWKGRVDDQFLITDVTAIQIPQSIDRQVICNRALQPYVRTSVIERYEKGLLFVDGKFQQVLEPGDYYWWKNAVSIDISRIDIRQQQLEINGQEILTKDKAALRINAWAQYKVTDIQKAILEIKDYDKQLYVAFQLVLREYIAGFSFDELLDKKNEIATFILQAVVSKATELGVIVQSFGIRDIILPGDLKEIMNCVLIAEKNAQANSIMRREETASTRSLMNTAKLMEDNSMLWKLKEMEYVEKIADKISSITLSGNGVLIDQIKQIFVPRS